MGKDSKPAYKEPAKIEDRKVLMAPEQSVKDGLAFFLRQEQEKIIMSTMTEEQKFDRIFPAELMDELQYQFGVACPEENIRAFALHIFTIARAQR